MDPSQAATMLAQDPVGWLLGSEEPSAVWTTLTSVLGRPDSDPVVKKARQAVVHDGALARLADRLPMWGEQADAPGHDTPAFLPNMLGLLSDLGFGPGDHPRIETILDEMLAHQDREGRFESFRQTPKAKQPAWLSLLCDTHAVSDIMFRFGRSDDPRVALATQRMKADIAQTDQGLAWRCEPERRTLWRGPGRTADACPIVTLHGLRAFSHLSAEDRPESMLDIARTPLEVWRRRVDERPYAFGHGYQFTSVKWPNIWYDVLYVLEAVGRFPELWTGPDARESDVQAIAEMAACLIAHNFDERGRVTPRRAYGGFEAFSFGQKREPSPFATARALVALERVGELASVISAVDVGSLPASKSTEGDQAVPRGRRKAVETACHAPSGPRSYPRDSIARRVIERHHLLPSERARSAASVTADIVGLRVRSGAAPYLSLLARIPGFTRDDLDDALYTRRSLVRSRAMRGHVFIVRPSMLQVLFCATSPEVLRYSRHNLDIRGVDAATYGRLASRILDLTGSEPLSTRQLRERLDTHADVGAVVTLMCDEGLLLRDRPAGSWRDLRMTYVPFEQALPEIRLTGLTRVDASARLIRAYVRGFGPVTRKDIVWWTGVGAKRVDPALGLLGDEIVSVTIEGSPDEHLVHAADIEELDLIHSRPRHSVALVPALDPFTMGYASRERYIDDALRPFVMDRAANTAPVVLVDGRAAGVWDVTDDEDPRVLVHLFGEGDPGLRGEVAARARELGSLWATGGRPITFVPEMRPLPQRAVGSFMRPLRGTG